MIVHVHLPKTAGSALNHFVLTPNFPKRRIFRTYGVKHAQEAFVRARRDQEFDLVLGHIHYHFAGLHREPGVRFVSVLREPVDRLVSEINFTLHKRRAAAARRGDPPPEGLDGDALLKRIAAKDAARRRHADVMTKLVSGQFRTLELAEDGVARAVDHLSSPSFHWDVQDRFDAFADRLHRDLGLARHDAPATHFQQPRDGETPQETARRLAKIVPKEFTPKHLTAKTRALAEDMNRADLKLYEWALAAAP